MFQDRFYRTKPLRSNRKLTVMSSSNLRIYVAIACLFVLFMFALSLLLMWSALSKPIDQPLVHRVEDPSKPALAAPAERKDAMFEQPIADAAERVNQTVVSIISYADDAKGKKRENGIGSGVIFQHVDGKVHVVTNYHVVEQGDAFDVVLYNEEYKEAKVIGKDLLTDLAVLEMSSKGIEQYAVFGNSDQLREGETVIAIGNPLGLGFSPSTTAGVISSTHRVIPISLGGSGFYDWEATVIQTDAAINRGNSGGALVNLYGEVIGINSMKIANFGVEGLGFAIPSNTVVQIIESLIAYGKVKRPFVGVATVDFDYFPDQSELDLPRKVEAGLVVMSASGPAEEAGLQQKDFIIALDGIDIETTLSLRKYIYEEKQIGDSLEVTFYRERKKQTITLILGESE